VISQPTLIGGPAGHPAAGRPIVQAQSPPTQATLNRFSSSLSEPIRCRDIDVLAEHAFRTIGHACDAQRAGMAGKVGVADSTGRNVTLRALTPHLAREGLSPSAVKFSE